MKEKLSRFFFTAPIKIVVGIPALISLILLFIIVTVPDKNTNILTLKNILIPIAFFFMGSMGIPIVIRRESPVFFTNEENAAAHGMFLVVSWWIFAVLYIILSIFFS